MFVILIAQIILNLIIIKKLSNKTSSLFKKLAVFLFPVFLILFWLISQILRFHEFQVNEIAFSVSIFYAPLICVCISLIIQMTLNKIFR